MSDAPVLHEAVPRGFRHYAQLRLRDHRPGIGDYQLPPAFGPGSGSREPTIFSRRPIPNSGLNPVGPGEYSLPDAMGTGPAAYIGPLLERDDKGNPIFPPQPQPVAADGVVEVRPAAKQYSMAETPDGPLYSIAHKLQTGWGATNTGDIGPGAYNVPDGFVTRKWGVPPGASFGVRSVSAAEREKMLIPGPGTYTLKDWTADCAPTAREKGWGCGRSRHSHGGLSPAPGAYDDPTTIQARITGMRRQMRMCTTSTFGGRPKERGGKGSCGPGPGFYNTDKPSRVIERNKRHPPRFVRPSVSVDTATKLEHHEQDTTLPSEFDYDIRKGKSMLGRWNTRDVPRNSQVGPGDYDVHRSLSPPRGGRFAGHPYDPFAAEAEAASKNATGGDQGGSGGSYNPSYKLVEPRAPCAIVTGNPNGGPSAHAPDATPGPGHYVPDYTGVLPDSNGTVFHRGDFRGRGMAENTPGAGPGANYNDGTAYSRSIEGDRANGKGFTFGIRYPARATHQVCKPYDETTNMNCVYPDELTWETQVRFAPTKPTKK